MEFDKKTLENRMKGKVTKIPHRSSHKKEFSSNNPAFNRAIKKRMERLSNNSNNNNKY